ncbi:MAG: hypothetical protein HXS47_02715 [Theionarchaea archaeon]|nr:hypothetical protein [Theionarchaea archaeon]
MFPIKNMLEEDNEHQIDKYARNHKQISINSSTYINILNFMDRIKHLRSLKEKNIINDEIFYFGTGYIISKFIIDEIDVKVSKVIIKLLLSDLFHEINNKLEKG